MDKTKLPQINAAFLRVEDLVRRLVSQRRAEPDRAKSDDLLDLLVTIADHGEVAERQLIDLVIFFFIAGYDTSKNVLTYTMLALLDRPEVYQRCAVVVRSDCANARERRFLDESRT